MASHDEGSCAHCLAVVNGFKTLFKPENPKHFTGMGGRWPGWSDKPSGVQWSMWHDVKAHAVELAVNLEGMMHGDDWPIGRVIERERVRPLLPSLAAGAGTDIRAWVARDVWNPAGPGKIRTDDLLEAPAPAVSAAEWIAALDEVRESQGDDRKGPAFKEMTLKNGKVRTCRVSPHIHFAVTLWGGDMPSYLERPLILTAARSKLQPFHDFLSRQATP